jgi:hypothetical protein
MAEMESIAALRREVEQRQGPLHPIFDSFPELAQRELLHQALEDDVILDEQRLTALQADNDARFALVSTLLNLRGSKTP